MIVLTVAAEVVAATAHALVMMENDGSGRFSVATLLDAKETTSITAVDYDSDGDLDIYACRYLLPDQVDQLPNPFHDANNRPPNLLLRNEGGHFTYVAPAAGVEDVGAGMGVSWSDYDRDGDMNLYVSNMFSSAGNASIRYRAGTRSSDVVD